MGARDGTLLFFRLYWKSIFTVIWPLLCLPIFLTRSDPFNESNEKFRCLFVIAWMWGYWAVKVVPAVIAFLPVIMLPLLTVLDAKKACLAFFSEMTALFLMSAFIYTGISFSGLHKRLVYIILSKIGTSPKKILLGVILSSGLLSVVVFNDGNVTMMTPLIKDIVEVMGTSGIDPEYEPVKEEIEGEPKPKATKMATGLYLGAMYGSTIGGLLLLSSNTTTMAAVGVWEACVKKGHGSIGYVPWIYISFIIVVVMLVYTWIVLSALFLNLGRKPPEVIRPTVGDLQATFKEKLDELGPLSWREGWVLLLTVVIVLCWITLLIKSDLIGWIRLLLYKYIKEEKGADVFIRFSAVALFFVIMWLVIPGDLKCLKFCDVDPQKRPNKNSPGVVPWEEFNKRMPWGNMFYIGAGLLIAHTMNWTGLQKGAVENVSSKLKGKHQILILIAFISLTTVVTELISNTHLSNMFIPIAVIIGQGMEIHPVYFVIPTIFAISFSFMTTIGSNQNAYMAEAANISKKDMILAGILLKVVAVVLMFGLFIVLHSFMFDNEYPDYAELDLYTAPPRKRTTE